jgi:hypothetical protein
MFRSAVFGYNYGNMHGLRFAESVGSNGISNTECTCYCCMMCQHGMLQAHSWCFMVSMMFMVPKDGFSNHSVWPLCFMAASYVGVSCWLLLLRENKQGLGLKTCFLSSRLPSSFHLLLGLPASHRLWSWYRKVSFRKRLVMSVQLLSHIFMSCSVQRFANVDVRLNFSVHYSYVK